MSIPEYEKCMKNTLGDAGWAAIMNDWASFLLTINERQKCVNLLTDEEKAQVYNKDKGWYRLFDGGPLDPTRPGYMKHI